VKADAIYKTRLFLTSFPSLTRFFFFFFFFPVRCFIVAAAVAFFLNRRVRELICVLLQPLKLPSQCSVEEENPYNLRQYQDKRVAASASTFYALYRTRCAYIQVRTYTSCAHLRLLDGHNNDDDDGLVSTYG